MHHSKLPVIFRIEATLLMAKMSQVGYHSGTRIFIGSRALSFKRPLLSVCGFVCNFEVKYLGNQRS